MKIYNINTDNIWISGIVVCLNILFIGYFGYSGNIDIHSYIGLLTVFSFFFGYLVLLSVNHMMKR